jgi:Rod binding domain-containing protein
MSTMAPAAAAGSTAATEAYGKRVAQAAHQFEAVLLNSLLGSLEHSFSALPGKKTDSVADDYHSMGMQALSSTLAAHGGVGIASMIIRNLMRAKGQSHTSPAGLPKVT